MSKIKLYLHEDGTLLTRTKLLEDYQQLKAAGQVEDDTFEDYISNCTDKNGALEEVEADSDDLIKELIDANGLEEKIYTTYDDDRTVIWKDISLEISTEIVGWYYGEPNAEDNDLFNGKLKAEY